MQLARVIGHATATIKHRSMNGLRMVIVQPLNEDRTANGELNLVVERLGAAAGQLVTINNDGQAGRELVGDDKTPVRWWIAAIVDPAY
jgi:ethanolamine utilization protein EutN